MNTFGYYFGFAWDFIINGGKGLLTNVSASFVPLTELAYALGYIDQPTRDILLKLAAGGVTAGLGRKALR